MNELFNIGGSHVDLTEVVGIGNTYHETRAHYRDDWWFFDVVLRGGKTLRVDARDNLRRSKGELIARVNRAKRQELG